MHVLPVKKARQRGEQLLAELDLTDKRDKLQYIETSLFDDAGKVKAGTLRRLQITRVTLFTLAGRSIGLFQRAHLQTA